MRSRWYGLRGGCARQDVVAIAHHNIGANLRRPEGSPPYRGTNRRARGTRAPTTGGSIIRRACVLVAELKLRIGEIRRELEYY